MNFDNPLITVAIPTYNRPGYAVQTVKEVLRQQEPSASQILVLDQTPEETIDSELREEIAALTRIPKVEWVFLASANLPGARNEALKRSQCPIIVFLDDDVLLPDGYLKAHKKIYDEPCSNVVGVTGPWYNRDLSFPVDAVSLTDPGLNTLLQFQECEKVDWEWSRHLAGNNHSVWRDAAIAVGGYDENYTGGAFSEDVDFTYRLRESEQGAIVCSPEVWLLHLKAPQGGCRILNAPQFRERDKLIGFFLISRRHPEYVPMRKALKSALRAGPFRRENLSTFWRIPALLWEFFLAWKESKKRSKVIISTFVPTVFTRYQWQKQ